MLPNSGFRVQADPGPRTKPDKTDNNGRDALFFCFEKGEMLPNFGFRVQADPGPRTKPDKTDNNGRDALFFALKRGKCCPILGLGFRLTQARGQKLTKLTKTVAMLCFSL